MYKEYNAAQLTLPKETSVLIPTNGVETIPKTEYRHYRGATSFLVTFSILIV